MGVRAREPCISSRLLGSRLLAASVMNRSIHLLARLLLQRRLQYWEGSASEIRPAGHGGRQDVGMYPCALLCVLWNYWREEEEQRRPTRPRRRRERMRPRSSRQPSPAGRRPQLADGRHAVQCRCRSIDTLRPTAGRPLHASSTSMHPRTPASSEFILNPCSAGPRELNNR